MSLLLVSRMSGVGKSQFRRGFLLLMTRTTSSLTSPPRMLLLMDGIRASPAIAEIRNEDRNHVCILEEDFHLRNRRLSLMLSLMFLVVLEVLRALKSVPGVAFKFFQWILDLHPNEISSKSYNAMLLIFGLNGDIDGFWSLVDTMRKKGFCVSAYVRDEVGEKFQKDGLVCDVKRLKELFATEDSLSRMVCKIVKNNVNMHKELKDLEVEFKSSMVKLILERLSDVPEKLLLFFRWVEEFGSFTHDEKMYNALAKILGRETSLGSFRNVVKDEVDGAQQT